MYICNCNGINCAAFKKALEDTAVRQTLAHPGIANADKVETVYASASLYAEYQTPQTFGCGQCKQDVAALINATETPLPQRCPMRPAREKPEQKDAEHAPAPNPLMAG